MGWKLDVAAGDQGSGRWVRARFSRSSEELDGSKLKLFHTGVPTLSWATAGRNDRRQASRLLQPNAEHGPVVRVILLGLPFFHRIGQDLQLRVPLPFSTATK
jgi:hypothetical protein